MKYNYSQNGYHPKDVSFEVDAMCREYESQAMKGYAAVRDTVIGTSNYNQDSYAKQCALGFNPLTDQETTIKYVTHKHKIAELELQANELKEKRRRKRTLLEFIKHTAKKSFSAIIQDMITCHIVAESIVAKHKIRGVKQIHPTFLSVNDILEEKNISVKYSIHPHVDSLLRTRYGDKALHL